MQLHQFVNVDDFNGTKMEKNVQSLDPILLFLHQMRKVRKRDAELVVPTRLRQLR